MIDLNNLSHNEFKVVMFLKIEKPNICFFHGKYWRGRASLKLCKIYEDFKWKVKARRQNSDLGQYEFCSVRVRWYAIWAFQQNRQRYRFTLIKVRSSPYCKNWSRRCELFFIRWLYWMEIRNMGIIDRIQKIESLSGSACGKKTKLRRGSYFTWK